MNDLTENLNRIETLLTDADHGLKNDDGRRWPPPPPPPSDPGTWATDNTGAVDPNEEASIKEYAFATLPTRPMLHPNMFPQRAASGMIWRIWSQPQATWIRSTTKLTGQCLSYLRKDREWPEVEVRGDHELFGIKVYARKQNGITEIMWRFLGVTDWDRRQLTYAQRVAEGKILYCLLLIRDIIWKLSERARRISESFARMKERGLAEADDYDVLALYVRKVALPIERLNEYVIRFNRLTRRFYRMPGRWLPVVRSCYVSDFSVYYPWLYVKHSRWYRRQLGMSDLVGRLKSLREDFERTWGC